MKHNRILLTSIFLAIFSLCANAANHPTPPVIDVVIEPIHVNDDDDSAAGANEVIDFNEVDTDSGELSKVTITLKKLIDQESVTKYGSGKLKVIITGKEYVRIWKNADRSELITLSNNTIFDKDVSIGMTQDYVETFYVEGIKHSITKVDVIIEAGYTVDTAEIAKDTAKTGVWQVDLDVDSENKANPWNKKDFTRGIDDKADAIEASNKDNHPGKIYFTGTQPDVDSDGVPDWADGYGVAGGKFIDNAQFLPVVVELPEPYDMSLAKVQFGYTLSPLLTSTPAEGAVWTMPSSGMRLWKKDAIVERTSDDLIKPDAAGEIKWVDLAGSSRKVTLYLEAVTDGVYAGKKELKITVTGDGSVKVEDKVVVNLLPVEVIFFKSDTESNDDWNSPEKILPDGEIYLIQAKDPQPIKFKVSVSAKITEEQFKLLELSATSIIGENSKSSNQKATNVSLSELSKVTFHQTDNGSTARCQIDQDLWKSKFVMQSAKDSVFSVDWSDFDPSVDQYTKSTYEDSDVFDQAFEKIRYSLNGKARGEGNWTEKEISDSVGKISSWSASAYSSSFKAAGYCRFTLNSTSCAVMEQAKIAYFSTHGAHSYNIRLGGYPTGVIETAELSSDPTQPKRIYLKPEDMEWHAGLDVAVMAACAVLDVNDYNNNYKGTDHFDSPGERWEKTGPRILLGYNNSAPIDIPNGLAISKQWAKLVTTTNQDPITCWALATYNHNAYHSCAIEKGVGYWYYPVEKIYFPKKKKPYLYVSPWTFVKKSDW